MVGTGGHRDQSRNPSTAVRDSRAAHAGFFRAVEDFCPLSCRVDRARPTTPFRPAMPCMWARRLLGLSEVGADRVGTWRPHCSNADRLAGALDDRRARRPGDGCPGGTVPAAAVRAPEPGGHGGAPSERPARTAATSSVIEARRWGGHDPDRRFAGDGPAALDVAAYEDPRAGDPGCASCGVVVRRALAGHQAYFTPLPLRSAA